MPPKFIQSRQKERHENVKIQVRFTGIASHLCCRHDKAGVQTRPQQPKCALTDFDLCSYTAARSRSLPLPKVSTSIVHVNTFTGPEWMEGWDCLFGWPTEDSLLTKWSHVTIDTCDHFVSKLSSVGQPNRQTQPSIHPGKVHRPETDVLITEPRCQKSIIHGLKWAVLITLESELQHDLHKNLSRKGVEKVHYDLMGNYSLSHPVFVCLHLDMKWMGRKTQKRSDFGWDSKVIKHTCSGWAEDMKR